MPSLIPEVNQYRYPWLQFCFRQIDEDAAGCSAFVIGQVSPNTPAAGLATVDTVVRINSVREAINLWGEDAIVTKMVEHYMVQGGGSLGKVPALFVGAVADGTTQAEYTYTITGTATEYKQYYLELPKGARVTASGQANRVNANEVYAYYATPGDTETVVAAGLAAAINADTGALFTAVAAAGVLTLTAKTGGTAMNGIGLELEPTPNYTLPDGFSAVWAQSVQGAGDPDLTTLMGNLGNCCFLTWALGFDDATARQLIIEELQDRWDCNGNNCFGHFFAAVRDTFTNLYTTYDATNDREITYIPLPTLEKYPSFLHAAAWAGRQTVVYCNSNDPGVPVVRQLGKLEAMCASQSCGATPFSRSELNQLAFAGVGTWDIGGDGLYRIQNNVTNYKRDDVGQADDRWRETATRYVVPTVRDILSEFYTTYYANHKAKRNGTELKPGSRTVTPVSLKAHLGGWLRGNDQEFAQKIAEELFDQDDDAVADGLVVEFDATDCNRMNVFVKASLLQPLMRISTTIEVQSCAA